VGCIHDPLLGERVHTAVGHMTVRIVRSLAVTWGRRQMTTDKVVEEIEPVGRTVIKTNLGHENADKLRAALESAQKSAVPAVAASQT